MGKIRFVLFMLLSASLNAGELLIVGGALQSSNHDVLSALAENGQGGDDIVIIPTASSNPISAYNSIKQTLVEYGVAEANIQLLRIAVTDDDSTEENEATWRHAANDPEEVKALENARAIWFVGGDQMRILEAFKPNNEPSLALNLLRQKLAEGALVGGTSAGAAIMSHPMIAAGDSFSAFYSKEAQAYYGTETQERGALYLHDGLGFFPFGFIDQHFDRKSRLGRLAQVVASNDHRLGIGIDENTGILVDLQSATLEVLGASTVSVLSKTDRTTSNENGVFNLTLSILSQGDTLHIPSLTITATGATTVDNEYLGSAAYQGGGMAFANALPHHALAYDLLDNSATSELRRYSFDENGQGLLYRFVQGPESQGYWRYSVDQTDQYTVESIQFDIQKVTISIEPSALD